MEVVKKGEFNIPIQIIAGALVGYSAMGTMGNLECVAILLNDGDKLLVRIGAGSPEFVQKYGQALTYREATAFFFRELQFQENVYNHDAAN